MARLSLYRKYRPTSFDEVVGQSHVTRTLANAIGADEISHAYLFAGPRGTGKTTTARILAKAVNCGLGASARPCGECDICRGIAEGSAVDVLEIDAASNRGIDEIRELRERVRYAPAQARYKVYIIDEVHMLTPEAFNALLKTLEEPPEHAIFVLATTELHKVPPTVRSRCQQFDFRRISAADIAGRLEAIAREENLTVASGVMALISEHAQGSLRDAIQSLDQLAAFCDAKIEMADAEALLGVTDRGILVDLTGAIHRGLAGESLKLVNIAADSGHDLRRLVQDWTGYLRDLLLVAGMVGEDDKTVLQLVNATAESLPGLKEAAARLTPALATEWLKELGRLAGELRWATDPKLALEVAVVGMAQMAVGADVAAQPSPIAAEQVAAETTAAGPAPVAPAPAPVPVQPSPVAPAASAPVPSEAPAAQASAETPPVQLEPAEHAASPGLGRPERRRGAPRATSEVWARILSDLKSRSAPAYSLLMHGLPGELGEQTLKVAFRGSGGGLYMSRLESPRHLGAAEASATAVIGRPVRIICELVSRSGGTELTPPEEPTSSAEAATMPEEPVTSTPAESEPEPRTPAEPRPESAPEPSPAAGLQSEPAPQQEPASQEEPGSDIHSLLRTGLGAEVVDVLDMDESGGSKKNGGKAEQ